MDCSCLSIAESTIRVDTMMPIVSYGQNIKYFEPDFPVRYQSEFQPRARFSTKAVETLPVLRTFLRTKHVVSAAITWKEACQGLVQ